MTATVTLQITGGVRIVVPDALHLITPYVLLEQQDWFEDEIKFLRRLLQPGQRVVDIGANHGVYSLSMAQTVGPAGCVWAFEPASATARLLAESIAANAFSQVQLDTSALSDRCGTATLSLDANSELNTLVRGAASGRATETVPLLTLDECLARHDWREIHFLKIDAEGEESRILAGGARFFAELSPLVQYEVKAGRDLHLDLVQQFAALGYSSYRLVPGLDLLVPFDSGQPSDGYLLNLFACKADCAERIASRGYLLTAWPAQAPPEARAPGMRATPDRYDWQQALGDLPYAAALCPRWRQTMEAGESADVAEALRLYALSRDAAQAPGARFSALDESLALLKATVEQAPRFLRLASLARVAQDHGSRAVAVEALRRLTSDIVQGRPLDPGEPFLAPAARFDTLAPGAEVGNWVLAATLEEWERLQAYSSYYTADASRQRLEAIASLGFASDEMLRRLRLVRARFGGAVARRA
jgi:FkbM family methyltransferase